MQTELRPGEYLAPSLENVSFREAFWTWTRIAALSFGGPAGQIAVMHRILVEEKRWIGETRFLHALNYCMLIPGPEAHQLAVYIGWLMHRVRGGILAGTLFILPGLVALGMLSWLYASFGQIGIVGGLFFGLKAAVLAIVLEAVQRIGKRALKSPAHIGIAAFAFVGIFFLALPFPVIIIAAALIGITGNRTAPAWFRTKGSHVAKAASADQSPALIDATFEHSIPAHVKPSLIRTAGIALAGALIWFAPLFFLIPALGISNVFTTISLFNSKMAIVTFGGAYAVLAYMAQQAVTTYHWLNPSEMLIGLGFAETTPGPLICVVQFVGYMAAFRNPGALDPAIAGMLGGLLAMWATFVPSFLWIFLGGPYIEALIGNKSLNAALSAITAAVVGVILNLAVWFALHTLFGRVDETHAYGIMWNIPDLRTIDWATLTVALAAMLAIFRYKMSMIAVLAASALAGIIYYGVTTAI